MKPQSDPRATRADYLLECLLRLELAKTISEHLTEATELKVYEMTGKSSRSEIESVSGLSAGTISNL